MNREGRRKKRKTTAGSGATKYPYSLGVQTTLCYRISILVFCFCFLLIFSIRVKVPYRGRKTPDSEVCEELPKAIMFALRGSFLLLDRFWLLPWRAFPRNLLSIPSGSPVDSMAGTLPKALLPVFRAWTVFLWCSFTLHPFSVWRKRFLERLQEPK